MTINVLRSIKAVFKGLTLLVACLAMILGFAQPAAQALTFNPATQPVLLEISETIPDAELSEKREQRREWQSQASSTNEVNTDNSESLGEVLNERLNLNEITETMKDNLNLGDVEEGTAEKVQQRSKFNLPETRQ